MRYGLGSCRVYLLKIWGCEAYVKSLTSNKLSSKSEKCIFLGYPRETKGYFFCKKCENKVFVARHGVFLEKEFLDKRVSGSSVHLEEVQDEPQPSPNLRESQENLQIVAEPILETPAPRRSDRVHRPPDKLSLLVEEQGDASYQMMMILSLFKKRWKAQTSN